jgi:hypothetical protein
VNTVFQVYSESGNEQLGLTVANEIVLSYNDVEVQEEHKSNIKFNTNINDGR